MSRRRAVVRLCFALGALTALAAAPQQPPREQTPPPTSQPSPTAASAGPAERVRFRNAGGSFELTLPGDWRQLAPNQARVLADDPRAPAEVCFAQPHLDYPVGPVDRWLAGDYGGALLHVVESAQEFHLGEDFAKTLADAWAQRGAATGDRYTVTDVVRAKVGTQQVDAVVAMRLSVPASGRPPMQSLDVHCPDGASQVTLSFCAPPERFAAHEAAFRQSLATLTFARTPRAPATLGDRLWPVAIISVVVCLVLWLAWRHTRGRR